MIKGLLRDLGVVKKVEKRLCSLNKNQWKPFCKHSILMGMILSKFLSDENIFEGFNFQTKKNIHNTSRTILF